MNLNIDECNEWKLDKKKNPITNRKIKINGPTYKKIAKLCHNITKSLILNNSNSSLSLIDSSLSYSIISSNNEKLKQDIINLIKVKRKKNLLIINKFFDEKFKKNSNNNCLTYHNNNFYINNILKLNNIIGIGGYGIIFKMKHIVDNNIINYVIKFTAVEQNENLHEIRILEFLTKYAIDYEFPHFPLTYDILACNKKNLLLENKIEYINQDIYKILQYNKGNVLFIINEFANGGDLKTYNNLINLNFNYENVKINFYNAISQILIGLLFYNKIVNSSHGDLHQYNVLNHKIISGGYFHYKLYEKDYYIENIGYVWVIWDFGLSTPFDNSHIINKKRKKELKRHIFKYLKYKKEPKNLDYYLGSGLISENYTYFNDDNNKEYIIKRNNILYDLKFFCKKSSRYTIYDYYIDKNKNFKYKFIYDLYKTMKTDVLHKCLKLNLTSDDLPIMQKMIIKWMVKNNLLLTTIPPKSKIINKGAPYIL